MRPAPKWLVYAQGKLNTRNYRRMIDSTATVGKDSDGYGLALGAAMGEKRRGESWFDVNAGYLTQDYDNNFLPDVDTFGIHGEGAWQVNDQLRLKALALRGIEENTLAGSSSHIMSRVRIGAEYAVAPRLMLEGDLRYTHNDFQINPASGRRGREDDILDASALVEYNILDDYYAGLEYIYVNRDSTDSSVEYTTNAVMARVSLKY